MVDIDLIMYSNKKNPPKCMHVCAYLYSVQHYESCVPSFIKKALTL